MFLIFLAGYSLNNISKTDVKGTCNLTPLYSKDFHNCLQDGHLFENGSGLFRLSIDIPAKSNLNAVWVNGEVKHSPVKYDVFRLNVTEPGPDIRSGVIGLSNSQFGGPILFNFEFEDSKATRIRIEIENQKTERIYMGEKLLYSYRWNAPILLFSKIDDLQTGTVPGVTHTKIKVEYTSTKITTSITYVVIAILSLLFLVMVIWNLFSFSRTPKFHNFSNKNIVHIALVGLTITFVSMSTLRFFPQQTGRYFDNNGLGFASAARYSDWYQLSTIAEMSEPYRVGHSNYPPAFLAIYKIISIVGPMSALVIITAISWATIAAIISWAMSGNKKMRFLLSLATVGLSYPFLFALDRGSSDLIMALTVSIFVSLVATSKLKSASAVLGFMIALKLFPVLFIPVLFQKHKSKRNVCIALATSLISTLLGSVFISGSLDQISYYVHESMSVQNAIAMDQNLAARSTSIIQWAYNLKSFRVPFANATQLPVISTHLVTVLIILLLSAAGIVILEKSLSRSEKLMIFSIISFLITPISNDYRLLLLMPILAYWIFEHEESEFKLHFVVLCGILFSVRPLLWVTESAQTLGGLLTMPILLTLFVIVIMNRLKSNTSLVTVQQSQISPGGT